MVFNSRVVPVFMLWLPKISGSSIVQEIKHDINFGLWLSSSDVKTSKLCLILKTSNFLMQSVSEMHVQGNNFVLRDH